MTDTPNTLSEAQRRLGLMQEQADADALEISRLIQEMGDLKATIDSLKVDKTELSLMLAKALGEMENALSEFSDCGDAAFFDQFVYVMTDVRIVANRHTTSRAALGGDND